MITISNQIEIRHLRYFAAVAEELHFRKAAEKLFISQPGLSRQISQMEDELGVQLFHRDKKKVSLTKAGEFLYQEMKVVFNKLDYVFDRLKFIELGEEGEIRIGFVGSAMQTVIPSALLQLNSSHPNIHALLHEMPNALQIESLMHEKIDVGFVRLSEVPESLAIRQVYSETFSLVLPENHPVNEQNFQSLSQLAEDSFILFSSDYSYGYYDRIMSIFHDHNFSPIVSHRTVHAGTIFRLVENNLGVAIVPTSLLHGFSLKIIAIELSDLPQRATLSMVWRKLDANPLLAKFLKLL